MPTSLPGALCRDCGAHMHTYYPDRCRNCQDQRQLDATTDPIHRQHLKRLMSINTRVNHSTRNKPHPHST